MKTYRLIILVFAIFLQAMSGTAGAAPGNKGNRAKIRILHADRAIPGRDTLPTKLLGNVRLKHNDIIISCDSLYQYERKNFVKAFSRVHMVQNDTLNMWGELATYDGNSQMAKVRRKVKLQDPQITLTTDFLDYDAANEIGHYFNTGHIEDSTNTLDSELGYYYVPLNTLFFRKDVVLRSPQYLMESDTMKYHTVTKVINILGPSTIFGKDKELYSEDGWYNTLTAHAELYKNNRMDFSSYHGLADTLIADSTENKMYMYRNVELQDSLNGIIITGHYGEALKTDNYAFVTDSAMLTIIGSPKDTIYLHSDTLTLREITVDDSIRTQTFNAFRGVRFFHKNLQGQCDSMSLTTLKDTIVHLYYDPVVWATGNQMTADNIDLHMKNGKTEKFVLKMNALIINLPDTNTILRLDTNMYNQVRGRIITGLFKDNDLYRINVNESCETIYYPDEKGVPFALTYVLSTKMSIDLEKRKVKSINFLSHPDGQMTPLFMVKPQNQFLKGFKWRAEERPATKEEIFIYPLQAPAAEDQIPETE